jgi:HK97 family phage major capsid protein
MNKYHNHAAKRRSFEGKIFNCLFGLMAIVGLLSLFGVFGENHQGMGLAVLPMFGIRPMLCDINAGDGNQGGGGQSEFQAKVLGGIAEVKSQYKTIEGNFATLDKESKKIADDFANHCKAFESMPSQIIAVERSLAQIQLKVAQERRSSYGSAVERISADDEMRTAVNGMIRSAARANRLDVPMTEAQVKGAEDYKRALSDAASPGSTYINAQLLPAIYSTIAEFGIWRNFDVIPVRTSSAKMIVDATDPVMYWSAENAAPTESAITGSNVTATINKLLGWIQVSRELLGDSEIDLTGHLLRKFANAAAYGLDWACLQADGGADATDGGFTGVFGGSGTASVAVAGNVSAATLDFDDFLSAMLAVDAAVLSRPTTRWIIHPRMLVRILAIKDLNGRPIFLPSTDAPALGAVGSILGYPVLLAHGANSTDGVSKRIAVFGDTMGQAVCLRNDFEFAASEEAKFTEDSVVFRARVRGAAKTKVATAFGVLTTAAS